MKLLLDESLPAHAFLFGEDQGRYLVATRGGHRILSIARDAGVPLAVIGRAGGDALEALGLFSLPLERLRAAHEDWLPGYMAGA